jgi:hypothetical protein
MPKNTLTDSEIQNLRDEIKNLFFECRIDLRNQRDAITQSDLILKQSFTKEDFDSFLEIQNDLINKQKNKVTSAVLITSLFMKIQNDQKKFPPNKIGGSTEGVSIKYLFQKIFGIDNYGNYPSSSEDEEEVKILTCTKAHGGSIRTNISDVGSIKNEIDILELKNTTNVYKVKNLYLKYYMNSIDLSREMLRNYFLKISYQAEENRNKNDILGANPKELQAEKDREGVVNIWNESKKIKQYLLDSTTSGRRLENGIFRLEEEYLEKYPEKYYEKSKVSSSDSNLPGDIIYWTQNLTQDELFAIEIKDRDLNANEVRTFIQKMNHFANQVSQGGLKVPFCINTNKLNKNIQWNSIRIEGLFIYSGKRIDFKEFEKTLAKSKRDFPKKWILKVMSFDDYLGMRIPLLLKSQIESIPYAFLKDASPSEDKIIKDIFGL